MTQINPITLQTPQGPLTAFHLRNEALSLVISPWHDGSLTLAWLGTPLSDADAALVADPTRTFAAPAAYSVTGDRAPADGSAPRSSPSPTPPWSPARLARVWTGGRDGDFRTPAFQARVEGRAVLDWALVGHRIYQGRPDLLGLVESRARLPDGTEAPTLELSLRDPLFPDIRVFLSYTVLHRVILVSNRVENHGAAPLYLHSWAALSIDLHPGRAQDLIHLPGAWARERQAQRRPLDQSRTVLESRRGTSSHTAWPGFMVCDRDSDDRHGEGLALALVHSGDWQASVEQDEDGGLRLQLGFHPDFLPPPLAPGSRLASPEAVLARSGSGLDALSRDLHAFVQGHIIPEAWTKAPRPVLINNWEATYFDFDGPTLRVLADRAQALGLELFVLDDGWFGQRKDDRAGLGDWVANEAKLGGSLDLLGRDLAARGLQFGLWFEPEMVNPDSDLYRAHPHWCLHTPGRDRSLSRNQLVLNLALPEVVDWIGDRLTGILSSAPIRYVKWDMNRPFSHDGVDRIAWLKGLYRLMGRITTAFPQVLFEGCAGGGGRMDYALLSFMPQFWTSDNTDALSRLAIQEGTGLFIPPSCVTAHVSAVPNHQSGRTSTLEARTHVALGGNLGYELDLSQESPEDLAYSAAMIRWYQDWREVLHQGLRHRLASPVTSGGRDRHHGWISVHPDGRAVVFLAEPHFMPNLRPALRPLVGLDRQRRYRLKMLARQGVPPGIEGSFSGALLMDRGVWALFRGGDPATVMYTLEPEN